jgi:hypothetical protein
LRRGLEAALEQQQRTAQELPFVELDRLRELVPLSHTVTFAAAQVNRAPEATMLRDLMPEAYRLRRKLLTSAVGGVALRPEGGREGAAPAVSSGQAQGRERRA